MLRIWRVGATGHRPGQARHTDGRHADTVVGRRGRIAAHAQPLADRPRGDGWSLIKARSAWRDHMTKPTIIRPPSLLGASVSPSSRNCPVPSDAAPEPAAGERYWYVERVFEGIEAIWSTKKSLPRLMPRRPDEDRRSGRVSLGKTEYPRLSRFRRYTHRVLQSLIEVNSNAGAESGRWHLSVWVSGLMGSICR